MDCARTASREITLVMKEDSMLTEQQAYDNWQAMITASHRVEVDAVKVYHCMHAGIPISQTMYASLDEHITHLRHVLDGIERGLHTLSSSESDSILSEPLNLRSPNRSSLPSTAASWSDSCAAEG